MTEVKRNKFHCRERTDKMNALSSKCNFEITIYTFSQGHSSMVAFQIEMESLRTPERQQPFQLEYPAASSCSIEIIHERGDGRSSPSFIQPSSFLMQCELRHTGK